MTNNTPDKPTGNTKENESTPTKSKRKSIRRLLLLLGPLVVLSAVAYEYFTGARFIETENAYVKASKASVSAQVSGPVVSVAVSENQFVNAGDTLFILDDKPYRIALEHEDANLQQTLNDIKALQASYRAQLADLKLAEADFDFYQQELKRQQNLSTQKMVAESVLDQARHQRDVAQLKVNALRQEMERIIAALGGDPTLSAEQHANVKKARADRDNAALDLAHTVITAPFAGITHNMPLPGDYVRTGSPVMNVISTERVWIDANYKETELTHVHDGQTASIKIDTYPHQIWYGKVQSISQATGAEFSVLPPQNATGNWVKVVQRIPVRIAFDNIEQNGAIRAGMSAIVEIDTGYERTVANTLNDIKKWFTPATTPQVAHADVNE